MLCEEFRTKKTLPTLFTRLPLKSLYEGEVIYDIVRRRAYILNFGRQFSTLIEQRKGKIK